MTPSTVTQARRGLRPGAHDIVVLVAAATVLVATSWPVPEWTSALPFMVSLALLSLMDVRLPHGDSVDVDAAVVIAAVYIFGPAAASIMLFLARLLSHLPVKGSSLEGLLSSVSKRIVGVALAAAAYLVVPTLPLDRAQVFAEVFLMGLAYVTATLLYTQIGLAIQRQDSVMRMAVSNVALQWPVLAAAVSVAILTVLIHDDMGLWGLLLVLFLAAMTRQAFALLLDVRQGYQATVEALIGAMEAQESHEHGVGRQVAILARAAGAEYGWFGKRVENMGYAALLLYFDLSFASRDECTGEARPTPLAEVQFLRPVAALVEAAENPAMPVPVDRRTLVSAYVVALCIERLSPERADRMAASLRGQLAPKERWRAEAAVERAAAKSRLAT